MKAPLVTVFMAAYNAGQYIEKSISSVINQTFKDFELVIVNDGSTDDTVTIVESISDRRIKLVHNDENRGIFYTRNRLLDLAQGKYIAILDSDDITSLNRLELQVAFMETHPNMVLCGGNAAVIDENDNFTGINYTEPYDDTIEVFMLFGNPYINSTAMFRKATFNDLGGYRDYAPAEDFELFTRMAAKHQVGNLNETLVKYRIHSSNSSTIANSLQLKNEIRILQNLRKELGLGNEEDLANIHLSLFKRQLNEFDVEEYASFLSKIKVANQRTRRYGQEVLDKFIFHKWVEILMHKRPKRAFFLLFDNRLFKWKYRNFKQMKKLFKRTFLASS
jgi:glycosyltransferase involved in cell wall biosynthesis